MMSNILRLTLIIILFGFLFLVRVFEMDLFYDPLITYFKNDYLITGIPEVESRYLVLNMLFRYTINSLITLGIVYLLFFRKQYVRFTAFFLSISFVILIVVFSLLLVTNFKSGYILPFYIRRFIIHPLFLLILLPALYYHYKTTIDKN